MIFILLLCICLSVVLVVIYFLNSVHKTADVDRLYRSVVTDDPTIAAFTLGLDRVSGQYANVFYDPDYKKALIFAHAMPVDKMGQSIFVTHTHGQVRDYIDPETNAVSGYTISGFDTIFSCPKGFGGPYCTINPMCEPEDVDVYKPLSFVQYNLLDLYDLTNHLKPIEDRSVDISNHRRIRIYCKGHDAPPELQVCPINKLLDENLQCTPYDLCTIKLDGFKHNLPVAAADPPLTSQEYYLCTNGKSVRQTCDDDAVYSDPQQACILRTPCFGQGDKRIYKDSHHYIQCRNNIEYLIDCPLGVFVDPVTNEPDCNVFDETCEHKDFFIDNQYLRYKYGELNCVDGQPQATICDVANNPITERLDWGNAVLIEHDMMPLEMYDNASNACKKVATVEEAVNLYKEDAFFQMSFGALVGIVNYSPVFRIVACDSPGVVVCDYLNNRYLDPNDTSKHVVPSPGHIFDHATPCPAAEREVPWFFVSLPVAQFPVNRLPILYGINANNDSLFENYHVWPVYGNADRQYKLTTITYQYQSKTFLVQNYAQDGVFFGFQAVGVRDNAPKRIKRDNVTPLKMLAYREFTSSFMDKSVWYSIIYGQTSMLRPISELAPTDTRDDAVPLPEPVFSARVAILNELINTANIKTSRNGFIDWDVVGDREIIVNADKTVKFDKRGMVVDSRREPPGYTFVQLTTTELIYGDLRYTYKQDGETLNFVHATVE